MPIMMVIIMPIMHVYEHNHINNNNEITKTIKTNDKIKIKIITINNTIVIIKT